AHPLPSADVRTGENIAATRYERSDVCVVPAAGVVGEAVLALALTDAWLEKFGGDSLHELRPNYEGYLTGLRRWYQVWRGRRDRPRGVGPVEARREFGALPGRRSWRCPAGSAYQATV